MYTNNYKAGNRIYLTILRLRDPDIEEKLPDYGTSMFALIVKRIGVLFKNKKDCEVKARIVRSGADINVKILVHGGHIPGQSLSKSSQ